MDGVSVRVKYFDDSLPRLKFIGGRTSDWVDLYAATTVTLTKGEFAMIPLGVAMELPEGYEAILAPRGSTFPRYGLLQTNSIGVIDESYCGDEDEWNMMVLATRDVIVEKGSRICQFRLIKHQPSVEFVSVSELHIRSRGGFGSTGK